MDEDIILEEASGVEFYLGTVTGSNTAGVEIRLDGQDSAMTKRYKVIKTCRTLNVGARVGVIKHSGTYIVLGEISSNNSGRSISDIPTSASLASVISTVNSILAWMRTQGMLQT